MKTISRRLRRKGSVEDKTTNSPETCCACGNVKSYECDEKTATLACHRECRASHPSKGPVYPQAKMHIIVVPIWTYNSIHDASRIWRVKKRKWRWFMCSQTPLYPLPSEPSPYIAIVQSFILQLYEDWFPPQLRIVDLWRFRCLWKCEQVIAANYVFEINEGVVAQASTLIAPGRQAKTPCSQKQSNHRAEIIA